MTSAHDFDIDRRRTSVRDQGLGLVEDAKPERVRLLGGIRIEDRIVSVGCWVAAAAMSWLICFRLLPWHGLIAYLLTTFVCGVILVATTVSLAGQPIDLPDRVASAVILIGALLLGTALVSTVGFIFVRGVSALPHLAMYFDDMAGVGPRDPLNRGGVAHAILGSLIEVGLGMVVAVPLGIGTAVYMTEIGGRFAKVVRTVVEAMTALPSIVAGLFIYTTLISAMGFPSSGLAAAAAIAVMTLPIIARASDVVLRVVPGGLREASLALGASRWRTVLLVVLPTAAPGLATALILGIARGVGETSPVLLTSGASTFFNVNPVNGVMNSLPLFIYTTVRSGEPIYIARAFGAATVLLALVLALFVTARVLARPRKGLR
jgi:phosphate transport system permease protein